VYEVHVAILLFISKMAVQSADSVADGSEFYFILLYFMPLNAKDSNMMVNALRTTKIITNVGFDFIAPGFTRI
jgi:hypothetical protein